ncbi:efflux RND transporter permease subunit [Paenibacillus alkalitolerans]|uniref:efflux RND transporter permease subunit n=1 Tax=Paenibacillus alkalitolerans TaxID=2799335 RepID=UPI0018F5535E|nr:efflux RND transporter permease subunit [Paenibacillus alkalitolerans]
MNFLMKASLRNGTAIVILCMMVLAGGLWSFSKLKVTEFPDIEVHDVVVHVSYPGANADDVIQAVTEPIERQLLRLQGYDNVESTTTDQGAGFIVSYPFTKDMREAVLEVQDAIDSVSMPDKVSVQVNQAFFDMEPVYAAAVTSERMGDEIRTLFLNEILPRLEKIPGAGKINVIGIGAARDESGNPVKLSDVARFEQAIVLDERSRFNNRESYTLEIFQARGANTVELTRQAAKVLQEYKDAGAFDIQVLSDKGQQARLSVDTMMREGVYGALFTVLIIFLFLRNIRATIIAILSLPLSLMATIMLLDYTNYTLNIMTLGALAVSVGRIVDDSIVAIENIYRWRAVNGDSMSRNETSLKAIQEVIGAIASSTFVAVVVFVPLGLVGGLAGEMFRPFAVTAAAAVLNSLLVSVAVIPLFGSRLLNKVKSEKRKQKSSNTYEKWLRHCLKRKGVVLSAAILLTAGGFLFVPLIGVSFLPNADTTVFRATVTLPAQTELEQTEEVAGEIGDHLTQWPEVDFHTAYIGLATDPEAADYGLPKPEIAQILIHTKPGTDPEQFLDRLDVRLTAFVERLYPGVQVGIREDIEFGPPTGENITVTLFSENMRELSEAARQVEHYMMQNESLKNVRTSVGTTGIGDVVEASVSEELATVHRLNGRTYAVVSADMRGNKDITAEVEADLSTLPMPNSVEIAVGGGAEDVQDGFTDLFVAMGASVGLIFIILSVTFGGVLTPVIILSSLVFVPTGVLAGLYLTGQSLSISSLVGMLMLLGIVVTNAIVLLDRVEANRKAGVDLENAIIEGAKIRLRPILMTACATICGLLPLAISETGGLISRGLAVTVIGGMTTSTVLTLIVVPVLYSMFGKYRRWSATLR